MELKSGEGEGVKAKDVGSISSKDLFFRADKIDFKNWDVMLEKHVSRVWSRDREVQMRKEDWEIDLAKLDIRNVIAHGTYGTVYKGAYDGQDIAGDSTIPYAPFCLIKRLTSLIYLEDLSGMMIHIIGAFAYLLSYKLAYKLPPKGAH
ncbi:hypothetical protein CsSME_00047092 [Camellia sinensis var. sinensis]